MITWQEQRQMIHNAFIYMIGMRKTIEQHHEMVNYFYQHDSLKEMNE